MPKSIGTYFKNLSSSNLPKTKNPKMIIFLFLWKAEKKILLNSFKLIRNSYQ